MQEDEVMTDENKNINIQDLENKLKELSQQLSGIEVRFTNLHEQVSKINDSISNIENKPNDILNSLNVSEDKIQEKFETLETKMNDTICELNTNTEDFKNNVDTKIDELDNRIVEWMDENTKYLEDKKTEIESLLNATNQYIQTKETETNGLYKNITEYFSSQKEELNKLINQHKTNASEVLTKLEKLNTDAMASNSSIKQIEADVKAFSDSVNKYITDMQESKKNINEDIGRFENVTDEICSKNEELTKQIEEQLQKATGASLFHTFQARKEDLEKTQYWWLGGIIVSTIILIYVSLKITGSLQHLPVGTPIDWFKDVFLKIALSTPVLYLLYFFTDRYTKTRRLVEEYAFKSTISLALKPYFDLIKGLNGEEEEKDKNFLIAVIGNIFTTPTDKVFRTTEKQYMLDFSNYYKSIADIINPSNQLKESIKNKNLDNEEV